MSNQVTVSGIIPRTISRAVIVITVDSTNDDTNAHDTLAGNLRWNPAPETRTRAGVSGASCNKICTSFQR